MNYFNTYSSNTYAGSGNQLFFTMSDGEIRTGRILYKISVPGTYHYSILFSNIMDCTFSDGAISHKNLICNSWRIHSAKIGICNTISADKPISEMIMADEGDDPAADIVISDLKELTFSGKPTKEVMPGEFFSSDPILCRFPKDAYLCLEITFSGRMIPYHEETMLPTFIKENDGWKYGRQMPFAGMIGCDRTVKSRIAYLGDSITQGLGTKMNAYAHWNALLSQRLGDAYAFWNLGLGFGRANDAASDGAWLYKAKQNDVIVVCYGVNDILKNFSEAQIKADLTTIVDTLKKEGKTVILQTVPPFNYNKTHAAIWQNVNTYIKTVLRNKVDHVFDIAPYLCESEEMPHMAKFGGHPNEEGCAIWADALYDAMKDMIV